MRIGSACNQRIFQLTEEARSSTPGLREMLQEDPDQWAPVFKEVIEETTYGAHQALEQVQAVPGPQQARETLYLFLEGGLVAGVFEGLASHALRGLAEDPLDRGIHDAQQAASQAASAGQLSEFIEEREARLAPACERLEEVDSVDELRDAFVNIFVEGYAIGCARSHQK